MSALDGLHPGFVAALPSYLWTDTADLYPPVKTMVGGREKRTFPAAESGDIPCRVSPSILERPEGREQHVSGQSTKEQAFNISLKGDYSSITTEYRVSINSVWYEITSVETDGNKLLTRLLAKRITPFNA